MKKLLALVALVGIMNGCCETKPDIFPNEEAEFIAGADTTYIIPFSDYPEPDYRGVLIEDLTGVKCVACPNAAEAAAAIKENENNNEVVILGLYPTDPLVLTYPFEGYIDLRTSLAQDIAEQVYNFGNILPGGGVNRIKFEGESSLNTAFNTWANKANSFENQKAIVNIEAETAMEIDSDSTVLLNAKFTFTEDAEEEPRVLLMLLENDIKHPQSTQSGKDQEYKHKHVVRRGYTPFNGSTLLTGTDITEADAGVVVERGWKLNIPKEVVLENASIAIIVAYNTADSREVIQCTELKIK